MKTIQSWRSGFRSSDGWWHQSDCLCFLPLLVYHPQLQGELFELTPPNVKRTWKANFWNPSYWGSLLCSVSFRACPAYFGVNAARMSSVRTPDLCNYCPGRVYPAAVQPGLCLTDWSFGGNHQCSGSLLIKVQTGNIESGRQSVAGEREVPTCKWEDSGELVDQPASL